MNNLKLEKDKKEKITLLKRGKKSIFRLKQETDDNIIKTIRNLFTLKKEKETKTE